MGTRAMKIWLNKQLELVALMDALGWAQVELPLLARVLVPCAEMVGALRPMRPANLDDNDDDEWKGRALDLERRMKRSQAEANQSLEKELEKKLEKKLEKNRDEL